MAEEELDVRVGRTRTGVSRVDDGVGSVIRREYAPDELVEKIRGDYE